MAGLETQASGEEDQIEEVGETSEGENDVISPPSEPAAPSDDVEQTEEVNAEKTETV